MVVYFFDDKTLDQCLYDTCQKCLIMVLKKAKAGTSTPPLRRAAALLFFLLQTPPHPPFSCSSSFNGGIRWSQLPGDILTTIVELLNTEIDTIHLRSVCHSWRLLIPPFKHIPSFPLTLPFPISPNPHLNQNRCGHFTLSHNTVYLVLPPPQKNASKSDIPWLFRVEESGDGKRRPLNPLSRVLSENVPQDIPKVLNLLDFPVFEIGSGFSLDYVETSEKPIETRFNELESLMVDKVVVSSNPFNDFEIVAIHGGKLGVIRLGDKKWSLIDDVRLCDDVIYHKGKLYAVDYRGNTVVIGSDLKAKQVASPVPYCGGEFKKLAQIGKDLYLMDRHMEPETLMLYDDILGDYRPGVINPDVEVHYKVYKLNEEEKTWERVWSLGDKSVFDGDGCSFVVSAQDFVGLKSNCIYFSEEFFAGKNKDLGDFFHDTGVYKLEDAACGPLSSFKTYSQFFWPPPSWLQPN